MARARTVEGDAGGRLRALDGLRFLAAAAVVAFHYTGRDSAAWPESVREVFPTLSRLTVYGGFGPYLFFMISGFVVLMSAWGRPVHSFVASRVGRLFPAYWIAVVLTAAVALIDPRTAPLWERLGLSGVALNLSMVQSVFGVGNVDGVYWTLVVELKFYLLLALLAAVGITRRRVLLLCLGWPLLGALALQAEADLVAAVLEPFYAPFFCLGLLLFLVYRDGWSSDVGLLLGLNYLAALWVCQVHYIPWSTALAGVPVPIEGLAVLLTASVASVALVTLTRVSRWDWRWLTLLGALTYPLYLVHQVIGWVLIRNLAPHLPAYATVAVVVALVLGLAYAVYRWVERPWGRRLRAAVERDLAGVLPGPHRPQTGPAQGAGPVPREALPAETTASADTVAFPATVGPAERGGPGGRALSPRVRPRRPVLGERRGAEPPDRSPRERDPAR